MPRYYFDIHHGGQVHRDAEGEDLPDHSAAHAEALKIIPEGLRNLGLPGDRQAISVDVRTAQGQVIQTILLLMISLSHEHPSN